MSKWISIKNTYPPEDTSILCYLDYKDSYTHDEDLEHVKNIIVGVFEKGSCWIKSYNWMWHKICCTHWCELPEPPKDNYYE